LREKVTNAAGSTSKEKKAGPKELAVQASNPPASKKKYIIPISSSHRLACRIADYESLPAEIPQSFFYILQRAIKARTDYNNFFGRYEKDFSGDNESHVHVICIPQGS
jgi:hypothetical protein